MATGRAVACGISELPAKGRSRCGRSDLAKLERRASCLARKLVNKCDAESLLHRLTRVTNTICIKPERALSRPIRWSGYYASWDVQWGRHPKTPAKTRTERHRLLDLLSGDNTAVCAPSKVRAPDNPGPKLFKPKHLHPPFRRTPLSARNIWIGASQGALCCTFARQSAPRHL